MKRGFILSWKMKLKNWKININVVLNCIICKETIYMKNKFYFSLILFDIPALIPDISPP